ncbi:uncharacterized protein LOC106142074 [Amyelois transitella]|uniref:uncharacterized protein LOC106142074 n=1 Tax=Amyelois transitella TaxID=680683 RepID=UPI00298FEC51|nr:uncharacterized protein LOC106142074 [Amyelois transitella]
MKCIFIVLLILMLSNGFFCKSKNGKKNSKSSCSNSQNKETYNTSDSKLTITVNITNKCNGQFYLNFTLLEGSEVNVHFHTSYYIGAANFTERGEADTRLALNSTHVTNLRTYKEKYVVEVDFINPINYTLPKNWILYIYGENDVCNEEGTYSNNCNVSLNGKKYIGHKYSVNFHVIGVSVIVNEKSLTTKSLNPQNKTYTYVVYLHRPGNQNIQCIYKGDNDVKSELLTWDLDTNKSLITDKKKKLTYSKYLGEEQEYRYQCIFSYNDVYNKSVIGVQAIIIFKYAQVNDIAVKSANVQQSFLLNGNPMKNDNDYYYEENESITLECFANITSKIDTDPALVLHVCKNDESLATDPDNNKQMDTFLQIRYSGMLYAEDDKTRFSCVLTEKLTNNCKPYSGLIIAINFMRRQFTTSEQIWFYPAVACAGLLIIVIIVFIIKLLRKSTRDMEELVAAEFASANEPPPPNFPHNSTLEDIYCKPTDVTYSNPQELYSIVIPKSMRNKQNTVEYASLEFKKKIAAQNEGRSKNSDINEPTYACIKNIDDSTTNYANVFMDRSEYAEPNYCEVSVVKKKGV